MKRKNWTGWRRSWHAGTRSRTSKISRRNFQANRTFAVIPKDACAPLYMMAIAALDRPDLAQMFLKKIKAILEYAFPPNTVTNFDAYELNDNRVEVPSGRPPRARR